MEFNITLNIDWIDEEYNLDETIKDEIIRRLTESFKKGISDNIKRKVNTRVSVLADEWIMEQLHLFCDRKIEITDKWGDTQEHHESVTEMFKSKFDEFFNATVDDKGKTLKSCSYGATRTTRIDHMLNKKAEAYLKKITDDMDSRIQNSLNKETKSKLEEKIKLHVAKQISNMVE